MLSFKFYDTLKKAFLQNTKTEARNWENSAGKDTKPFAATIQWFPWDYMIISKNAEMVEKHSWRSSFIFS